jgi:archaellum biogenesis protein FlaJ (TadC family)
MHVWMCTCMPAHQLYHSSNCSLSRQWSVITLTCAAVTLPVTLMALLIINIKLQMFLPVPLLVLRMAKTISCNLTVCWGCDVMCS